MNPEIPPASGAATISVQVRFHSYFKDLAGCAEALESTPPDSSIDHLLDQVCQRFPKIAPLRNAMLVAVGVEYQPRNYSLKQGDVVSLFPPVQGG